MKETVKIVWVLLMVALAFGLGWLLVNALIALPNVT